MFLWLEYTAWKREEIMRAARVPEEDGMSLRMVTETRKDNM